MNDLPSIYAIDFGTSNSLLAAANASRVFAPIPLDPQSKNDKTILRSIVYFPEGPSRAYVGSEALASYIDHGLEGRFLRSLKRHLATRDFRGTMIGNRKVTLDELIAIPLRTMRERANRHFGVDIRRAVLGRPARFSLDDADDDLAEARLRVAATLAGFEDVTFLPEPVAAAYQFQSAVSDKPTGRTDCIAMVCDFGGGTSDYTLLRVAKGRTFQRDDVLGVGGVPLAGDAFDACIMRGFLLHHFGGDVTYQVPLGQNVLTMPNVIKEQLCSPAHLSVLRRPDLAEFLRNVSSWSLGPTDKTCMEQLQTLVDDALGFQLFEHIEGCKRALSEQETAVCTFDYPGIDVHEEIAQVAFRTKAQSSLEQILEPIAECLAQGSLHAADVDLVCCTGGTARMPLVAEGIRKAFPKAEIRQFESFHAVVLGLANFASTIA
jgi:hypothetical chaperone protein